MIRLLTILFLLPFSLKAQEKKCDSGLVYFPEIGTSSLIIKGGCVTKEAAQKLWKEFDKNLCGEGGFFSMNDNYIYSRSGKWNDSTGCVVKETFKKNVKGKWVEITEKEYIKLNPDYKWVTIPNK